MDQIWSFLRDVVITMMLTMLVLSIITANNDANFAIQYLEEIGKEIAVSNFSPSVIAELEEEAEKNNYELIVDFRGMNEEGTPEYAKVSIKYHYRIPYIGVDEVKTINTIVD